MTAIAGLVDTDGTVYIGGDSAGTTGSGDQSILLNPKVFRPEHGPWFIFGCAGEFRLMQILQYAFHPPPPPSAKVNLDAFMATTFIDAVKQCFRKKGLTRQDSNGTEIGHTFLVGYQGRLFKIEENFQVLSDTKNFTAVGAGDNVALGALFATEGLATPEDRLQLALKASAHYNATVREPFNIQSLPFRDDWYKNVRAKKTTRRNGTKKAK